MKLIPALLLAGGLALASPALAQTPPSAPQASPQPQANPQSQASPPSADALAAANELLSIMSADIVAQMTSQMLAQAWPTIESQVGADPAMLKDIRSEFERVATAFTLDAMKAAPPIYANHFSAAELREIAAFYKTPTGAKALASMPKVLGEFYGTLVPRMPELEQELRNAIMAVIAKPK